MPSIIVECPVCDGGRRRKDCFNCKPRRSSRRVNRPGPGYILRGEFLSAFPVGAIVVDVYFGERERIVKKGKNFIEMERVSSGHGPFRQGWVHRDYSGDTQARWVSLERYLDPETWRRPARPPKIRAGQAFLFGGAG